MDCPPYQTTFFILRIEIKNCCLVSKLQIFKTKLHLSPKKYNFLDLATTKSTKSGFLQLNKLKATATIAVALIDSPRRAAANSPNCDHCSIKDNKIKF